MVALDRVITSLQQFLHSEHREMAERQCFEVYDRDKSGVIRFNDLLVPQQLLTSHIQGATPDQRLLLENILRTHPLYCDQRVPNLEFKDFQTLLRTDPRLMQFLFGAVLEAYVRRTQVFLKEKEEEEALLREQEAAKLAKLTKGKGKGKGKKKK